MVRYYNLSDLQHLRPIIEFIADIHAKNSQPTAEYYGICQRFARISKLTVQMGLAMYSAAILVIALPGTVATILTGVHKPSLAIYFPGIHDYSSEMTVLLFIFNHVMVGICFLTIPAGEMLFFVIFANIPMVPAIIKRHLDELETVLERKKRKSLKEIKIRMQRQYNE